MERSEYLALAAGRMPEGVKPGTASYRTYTEILKAIAAGKATMADAPLSDRQLARIVELLRS